MATFTSGQYELQSNRILATHTGARGCPAIFELDRRMDECRTTGYPLDCSPPFTWTKPAGRRPHAMDENLKAQLFPPLVVFNLTVGLYMLFRFFTSKHMDYGALFIHFLIGAAAGFVLGGITFIFTRKK